MTVLPTVKPVSAVFELSLDPMNSSSPVFSGRAVSNRSTKVELLIHSAHDPEPERGKGRELKEFSTAPTASVGTVHQALRQQILDGEIPSGTVLSQVDLAERFGVSRTPLREALRMLQEEGLITTEGRRARVAVFDLRDLEAISAQRILLSALATTLTVPRLKAADMAQMREHMSEMSEATRQDDAKAWRTADRAFHAVTFAGAPPRIHRDIGRLAERNALYQIVWRRDQPHLDAQTEDEHASIIEACERQDVLEVARHIARHQARVALMVMAQTAPEHDPAIVRSALQLVIGSD